MTWEPWRFCDCPLCKRREAKASRGESWHKGRFFRKKKYRATHSVEYPNRTPRRAFYADKRLRIYARDGFCCRYCLTGAGGVLTLDHVVPLCKGGTNDDSNLVTCCRRCNRIKGDKDVTSVDFIAYLKVVRSRSRYAKRLRVKYYFFALQCTSILEMIWCSTSLSRMAGSTLEFMARIALASRSFFSR